MANKDFCKNFGGYYVTGGVHSDDCAAVQMLRPGYSANRAAMLGGGPIDAPEYMPAGAVENTSVRSWDGRPVVVGAVVARD
jgi:hypothetical protein